MNAIIGGNGHGRCLNVGGKAERAEGALVVSRTVTRRERGFGSTFGINNGRRRRFARGRADGGRFGGAGFADRRLRDGCEHLERQCRKDGYPEYRSSEHLRNYKLPQSDTATEIPSETKDINNVQ